MSEILNVILSHHPPDAVSRMRKWWNRYAPDQDLLVAYGGTRENFDMIEGTWKVFVDDPRVRTRFHQKECQSYQGVFQAVSGELASHPGYRWLHFNECDQLPLVPDYSGITLRLLQDQDADAIGHFLRRIDGTGHPHFLVGGAKEKTSRLIGIISQREKKDVVLSMLGCGTFFKREAFDLLASEADSEGVYLEIFIPTILHHLGFRVKNISSQEWFMHPRTRKNPDEAQSLLSKGAWCAHPVNGLWTEWTPPLPTSQQ